MDKVCKGCGRELPIEDFYKHPKMADGHLNFRKDCVKTRAGAHREENIDRIRAYDRERAKTERRKILKYKETKKRNDEVPGYRIAHLALLRAVRNGTIHKPDTCQVCGKTCSPEAHHKNYADKLKVVWLCRECHSQYHQGKSERAKAIREAVDKMFLVKEIDEKRNAS